MAISTVGLSVAINWQQTRTNAGGYQNTTQGPDGDNFNLAGINVNTFNQIYAVDVTLLSGQTETIDLTVLQNLVYESFGYGHVLSILVLPTIELTVSPGTSNPFTWFFGGSTQSITINPNGMFAWSDAANAVGTATTGTAKTIKFTNVSATSGTVSINFIGGTS